MFLGWWVDLGMGSKREVNVFSKFGSLFVLIFFIIIILIKNGVLTESFEEIGKYFLFVGAPFTFYGFSLYYFKKND